MNDEDTWAIPLKFFNFYLIVWNCRDTIDTNYYYFKSKQLFHGIELGFIFYNWNYINDGLVEEYVSFFECKEIYYDMENKTSTDLNEKYNPTVLLDESELLYLKMKFEPIIGDISIGS